MSRESFRDNIQEKYKTAVHQYDPLNRQPVEAIPTGILSFDIASGIGGFPKGNIVEIYGPESGGKTLLSLVSLAYAQRMFGAVGLYFDLEGSTPQPWLETLGIDLNLLDIIKSDLTAEKCLDAVVDAIESDAYTYIIIDSVPAMISDQEWEGEIDQNYISPIARVMGKGVKKITSALSRCKSRPCVIFINQVREKVGVIMGNPEVTPGGKALKFFAAQRYRVKRGKEESDHGAVVGHEVCVNNIKNKLAPPKREGSFHLSYTQGLDTVKNIMDFLKSLKMYTKKGMKYILTIGDESLEFDTVGAIKDRIATDKDFQLKVYNMIIEQYFTQHVLTTIADDDFSEDFKDE